MRLAGHDNALNAIRLLLAVFVVIDHSYKAATGRPGPWVHMGDFAVEGFFAISGYLIAGSRSRMSMGSFLWRRALRLMPAYWALLFFTALVVAPLSTELTRSSYDWASGAGYVVNNSLLFTTQMGIGGTPEGVAYFGLWNASTWSLPFEAAAYVMFGLLLAMPGFGRRPAAVACVALSAATAAQHATGLGVNVTPDLTRLWSFFAAGVLLWSLRDRLPMSLTAGAGACTLVLGTLLLDRATYFAIAPVAVTFLLLWLGARLPVRVGARNDISYGVYLFAFPLQQLMAVAGVPSAVGLEWFAVLSVAVTVPVAWASWLLIEQPAMRLRRLIPTTPGPAPSVGAPGPVAWACLGTAVNGHAERSSGIDPTSECAASARQSPQMSPKGRSERG
ncbi:acyltransferase [Terrabacter tumescens]|uniref:Acyltransferase n=2 Tax=Terrabacter tumescens TaxID=60443 RepID=A0ABQ2IFD9_9MICO|nr:acyltransferase [Terrabacter tumescens]